MNLNQALLAVWEADVVLSGLCATDRVHFETVTEEERKYPEFPYVVIILVDDRQEGRTSLSFYDESLLHVWVYAETKEQRDNIVRESRRVLRSTSIVPDDDGLVVNFEKRGGSTDLQDGMLYTALDEYAVTRQRAR